MDLALPGIAGSEVEEYLREKRPDVQVVFVTANMEFAVTAFDLEVTDYLVKPFDDKRLGRCMHIGQLNIHLDCIFQIAIPHPVKAWRKF